MHPLRDPGLISRAADPGKMVKDRLGTCDIISNRKINTKNTNYFVNTVIETKILSCTIITIASAARDISFLLMQVINSNLMKTFCFWKNFYFSLGLPNNEYVNGPPCTKILKRVQLLITTNFLCFEYEFLNLFYVPNHISL